MSNTMQKKIDMTRVTEEVLTQLVACEDGKQWWLRNGLSGFPVDRIKDIEGEYNEYIRWLIEHMLNCTYDEHGNELTHTSSNGDVDTWTYTTTNQMFTVTCNGKVILTIPMDWKA